MHYRSQLPALMGTNESADDEPLTEDKRNLASLAKNNFFPREYKRSADDQGTYVVHSTYLYTNMFSI